MWYGCLQVAKPLRRRFWRIAFTTQLSVSLCWNLLARHSWQYSGWPKSFQRRLNGCEVGFPLFSGHGLVIPNRILLGNIRKGARSLPLCCGDKGGKCQKRGWDKLHAIFRQNWGSVRDPFKNGILDNKANIFSSWKKVQVSPRRFVHFSKKIILEH